MLPPDILKIFGVIATAIAMSGGTVWSLKSSTVSLERYKSDLTRLEYRLELMDNKLDRLLEK